MEVSSPATNHNDSLTRGCRQFGEVFLLVLRFTLILDKNERKRKFAFGFFMVVMSVEFPMFTNISIPSFMKKDI